MFLRIFLFGSAVVGLLVVALVWAVINGQYEAAQPTPVPSSSASGAPAPSGSQAAESASAAASALVEASPAASGATTLVAIANLSFGPNLSVAAGTTVAFENKDAVPHTATQGSNGVKAPDALFDLQLAAGASESYTFADAGSYKVTCTLHPQMNMTITVQ
jgi:plastocyanin